VAPIVGFDTNIVIPALLFPGGSPLLCVSMARNERIQSVTCQEILDEFSEKLIVKFTLSEEKTEEIIEEVCQFSRIVRINQELTLVSADPDDDMIIENLGLKPRRSTTALLLNMSIVYEIYAKM
jgi:putative PIN family toxin of toxin-antitoxin system